MFTDRYDNPLTTGSERAAQMYQRGLDRLLAGQADMDAPFHQALEADPGFAAAHAGLARARQTVGDMAGAQQAIAAAREVAGGVTARETSQIHMLSLMIGGKGAEALEAVYAHMDQYPRDVVVAQTSSSIYGLIGFSGQAGREAQMLAFLSRLAPGLGDDWWFLSQYAFALCETGQLARAEAMIDASLATNPDNAHAVHVRSHVSYEAGDVANGITFLRDWLRGYSRAGVMHGHLSWHQALWMLQTGDVAGMWALLDDAVTPEAAECGAPLSVLVDTASLLHRAEMAGVEVPRDRWAAISRFAAKAFPKTGNAFVDMHAAVAHAMAGDAEALSRIISQPAGPAADLVPDIASGFQQMAHANWGEAARHLKRAMADTARIGGSRAQRDLVEHSLLACLMRQGETAHAHDLAAMRRPVIAEAYT
ncbi:tetratricopeptide repeat protein [Roseobacter sp. YSTF-M11]|uniref:Tetratricopeptide repeat protein n=1 Tax=Roseobacter insulae TaxID=2859783 RepID=A0A9X1FUY4_9RHOB|nr:tetratricopeptide repeat protein [Roseobacter insulae]MBW4707590.1 tetratricopeptide repeat protein [Roseobacter insulae]